jgi:type IV pilus assembly protein PilW
LSARSARGFSLIELMVGTTVAVIVIGVVMGTFLSQQRAMLALDLSRDASAAIRDSMLMLEESIGRAGYGIDPRFAFDLRNYGCAGGGPGCRDKTDGPDELVFVERDPNYYWAGDANSAVQGCSSTVPCRGHAWQLVAQDMTVPRIQVAARAGDQFLKGQVLELVCERGGTAVTQPTDLAPQLMATVKTTVPPLSADGSVWINLENTSATNPYMANIPSPHNSCFDSGQTSVFLVNRYRFHVATINGDPWLMLDRGLDYNRNDVTPENGGDPADEIPIGHGVEDLQIAYLMKPPPPAPIGPSTTVAAPDNGADWVIGDTSGTVEEPDPTQAAPPPGVSDADTRRYATTHPANIRAVRISLGVRSLLTDKTQPSTWPGDAMTLFENRNVVTTGAALGRFRRFRSQVVVATPNLGSRDAFIF